MAHDLTQVTKVGSGNGESTPPARFNLISSASVSFIALMDSMQALMNLAHDAALNKETANAATSSAVVSAAQFSAATQADVAQATTYQAYQQNAAIVENALGGAVAGGSLFAQHSTTKFSTQMDSMLDEAAKCKNMDVATIHEPGAPCTSESTRPLDQHELDLIAEYKTKLNKGNISLQEYQGIVRGNGLMQPLKTNSRVTLKHVLAHETDPTAFDKLVDGVRQGREAANTAVQRKQNQIESASGIGNAIAKAGVAAFNGQFTLKQAGAQTDQGADSQSQQLAQAGVQFLQDAMKSQDQIFSSAWQDANQIISQFVSQAVSVDTRG